MKRLGLIAVALAILRVAPALAAPEGSRVNVLYAASLVNLMEHSIGPAFDKASGNQFQGYAIGSHRLDNQFQGFAMGSHRLADQIKGNLRGKATCSSVLAPK